MELGHINTRYCQLIARGIGDLPPHVGQAKDLVPASAPGVTRTDSAKDPFKAYTGCYLARLTSESQALTGRAGLGTRVRTLGKEIVRVEGSIKGTF